MATIFALCVIFTCFNYNEKITRRKNNFQLIRFRTMVRYRLFLSLPIGFRISEPFIILPRKLKNFTTVISIFRDEFDEIEAI